LWWHPGRRIDRKGSNNWDTHGKDIKFQSVKAVIEESRNFYTKDWKISEKLREGT
jgi:hypothetical protein